MNANATPDREATRFRAALDALDGMLAGLDPSAEAGDRRFLGCVFFENEPHERRYADHLVLAPGLDAAGPNLAVRVRALLDHGAAGVIVKRPESGLPRLPSDLASALLLLEREADWADVAQSLRALGSADARLVTGGIRQGDLFALANTLASLSNGAVSLVDIAGRIIGYSTHVGQPIDALRRSTTLALHEGHHPRVDAQFQQLAASTAALHFPGKQSRYGRVALPVRAAGELLGTVWAIQVDPSGADETRQFLDSVEPLVAHHMLRARETAQADERRSTDLIRALLEDATNRRAAAAQLDLDPGSAHTVICFRLCELGDANPVLRAQQLLHQVSTTAKGQFAWAHCALLDGVAVALLRSSDTAHTRLFADRITRIAEGGAVAGIGRIAQNQSLIPRSYRDAASISRIIVTRNATARGTQATRSTAAAGHVTRDDDASDVAEFSEMHSDLGLAHVGEILHDSELLEGDLVERILAHDREHETRLAETLLSVLDHQGSVRRAALDLHVHQNTVRYRLNSIRAELGIDMDHPSARLWIWLRLTTEVASGGLMFAPEPRSPASGAAPSNDSRRTNIRAISPMG
ncbi:CdaR family transcriptional regulator [Leucobacter sp. L43]|uniref:PucR family transcriptional regulator n=1 Tax=Leucobacter sp. L43 TaxID=2798040 RepID=UPI001903BF23|nr:helix-turn-helix domain-containing protein [Leucobacter sp. L43]